MIGVVWAAAAARAAATLEWSELAEMLATNGVAMDTGSVRQAVLEAGLRAIDPGARLLTDEEAALLEKARAGLQLPVPGTAATGGVGQAGSPGPRPPVRDLRQWPNGIAYLKVDGLFPGSGAEVSERLHEAVTSCVHGLIVDLRGAGGVDLGSAADVADVFARDSNLLFQVQDLHGNDVEVHRARGGQGFPVPVVILIDDATTGAAELLAALLRVMPRAVLVGVTTRGGPVRREIIPLPDGQKLLVALRRVLVRGGTAVEAEGVKPDIIVAPGPAIREKAPARTGLAAKTRSEEGERNRQLAEQIGQDSALRRAADLLLGLQALKWDDRTATNSPAR